LIRVCLLWKIVTVILELEIKSIWTGEAIAELISDAELVTDYHENNCGLRSDIT